MNPGVLALEQLVEMGVFRKAKPHSTAPVQYWADRAPRKREWANVSGLVYTASRWVGKRGLGVMRGRVGQEVVFYYAAVEDVL